MWHGSQESYGLYTEPALGSKSQAYSIAVDIEAGVGVHGGLEVDALALHIPQRLHVQRACLACLLHRPRLGSIKSYTARISPDFTPVSHILQTTCTLPPCAVVRFQVQTHWARMRRLRRLSR